MGNVVHFPRGASRGAGLFRPRIVQMSPSKRGGAGRKYDGISEDRQSWLLKLGETPAAISEWLGYKLSQHCQIAVPPHEIVELPRNEGFAFGSRVEAGLEDLSKETVPVFAVRAVGGALTKICALDMFIANDDRHSSNIIWRKNDLGERVPMAIDFESSLFSQSFPLPDLRSRSCKTTDQIRAYRQIGAWRSDESKAVLKRVAAIQPAVVADWVDNAPQDWLEELARARFLNWWGSKAFHDRVADCIMFCS